MEKEIIGEILNKRIAEMDYKQQEFADLMGMKKDTLRSYMNGSSAYSYELLIEFAEKLDCSYDYLLGYSKSPNRDYHELTEQTRLSEKAIDKLVKYAKHYDDDFEARRYIKSLDLFLCEDGAFNAICDYFVASKPMNNQVQGLVGILQDALYNNKTIKKMGIEADKKLSLETQQMIHIISQLATLKTKITPEFVEEIKKLEQEEDLEKKTSFFIELLQCEETQTCISKAIELSQKYGYMASSMQEGN